MFKRYWQHPLPYLIALLITFLYFYTPSIVQWFILQPSFRNYAYQDTRIISNAVQKALLYPFGQYLYYGQRTLLIFPYWVLIVILLRVVYLHTRKVWKLMTCIMIFGLAFLVCFPNTLLLFESNKPSQSFGHVSNGRIEHSKRLPFNGDNFTSYSLIGYFGGRTFVHEKVKHIILDAYETCQSSCPQTSFVIGETGTRYGGLFVPHTAHQNGLSADFMVPLIKEGKTFQNHHLFNFWGYALWFDQKGVEQNSNAQIDFEAMAKHLIALDKAAKGQGLVIQKIVFNPSLSKHLFAGSYGEKIRKMPFSQQLEVIPYDNHYHVDFGFKKGMRLEEDD